VKYFYSKDLVINVLNGKRKLTLQMTKALHKIHGMPTESESVITVLDFVLRKELSS